MNAKQKQEVIKMYAETIEAENDVKKRIRRQRDHDPRSLCSCQQGGE